MSTILKALRELERDRQAEIERDLRREIAAQPVRQGVRQGIPHRAARLRSRSSPARRIGGPLLAAGAGAALAVVGMGLWFVATEPPESSLAPGSSLARPSARTEATASAARALATPQRVESPPPSLAAAPRVEPSSPLRPAAVATSPPGSVAVARRDPVPELRIRRTVWHPDRGRRIAVVEVSGGAGPVELREGESLGSLVVVEITPAAVTFERDGVQLMRRVGAR